MGAVQARADEQPVGPDLHALVAKAFDGTLTSEERHTFVTEFPDVAAQVPDPHNVEPTTLPAKGAARTTTLAAVRCSTAAGHYHQKSYLGNSIYHFRHFITFCGNGAKVTSVYNQRYEMTQIDGVVIEGWSVIDKWSNGVNTSRGQARMQLEVRHCVIRVGCFARSRPWVLLNLYPNMTSSYQSGV